MLVPIALGSFSGVREVLLGELDERLSKVSWEVASLLKQVFHRVRKVDTFGCGSTTECAEGSCLGQELAHVVGRLGGSVHVLDAEGRCRHVVDVVVRADQIDGCEM